MQQQYILSIDQGTTGTTVLVIDRNGRICGRGYAEIKQHYPRPGWVEQDPGDIWQKTLQAVERAKEQAGISQRSIAAVGIANQRETTLLINRETGEAIGPAVVWQCRRTASRCDDLVRRGLAGRIRGKTGLVVDAYFSATKLEWLLEHVRDARRLAGRGSVLFATIDSWLIWKLTGGALHATDVSNASRTMLFNIHSLEWDEELLELFGVPRSMLPVVVPSSGVVGYTVDGIPVAGAAGDQQAALFGQACFLPGSIKVTLGTGAFLLMYTGMRPVDSRKGLVTTVAWDTGSGTEYALEGSIFTAGAVVKWLRDGLGLIADAAESEQLAAHVEDSGGVYFVPAFAGLGAPYWDASARGTVVGLTAGTTRTHLVRAALESIAYQVCDVVRAMMADSGLKPEEIRLDGGAAANNFLALFMADMLGVRLSRPESVETTALGAAYLAGLGVGFWKDREELAALRRIERCFEPARDRARQRRLYQGWRRAVSRSRHWAKGEE